MLALNICSFAFVRILWNQTCKQFVQKDLGQIHRLGEGTVCFVRAVEKVKRLESMLNPVSEMKEQSSEQRLVRAIGPYIDG